MFQLIAYLILVKVSRSNPPSIFKFLHTDLWYFHPFFWHWSLVASPCLEMEPIRYFQHLLWAPITLFCCALHQALWMWATVSNGRTSVIFSPCFSPFCKVGTSDSHELQSCASTSHMEMNTWSLAWLVFSWRRVPSLSWSTGLGILGFRRL